MIFVPITFTADVALLDTPKGIEAELRDAVYHTRFGSRTFHRSLSKFLRDHELNLDWERNLGPSRLAVGSVRSLGFDKVFVFVFWPNSHSTQVEVIPSLSEDINRIDDSEFWTRGNRLVLCGSCGEAVDCSWPFAAVLRLQSGRWKVVSARVSPDEESDPGTAFYRVAGRVAPNRIVATLRVDPPFFCQAHGGPWLRYDQTWTVRGDRIIAHPKRLIPTPLSELSYLTHLARHGDWSKLNAELPSAHRRELIEILRDPATVEECGNAQTLSSNRNPDIQMHFAKRRGKWFVRVTKSARD